MLAIVKKDLHRFNEVNLATAVNRMAKIKAPPDVVARAALRPAFGSLKTDIGAPLACA